MKLKVDPRTGRIIEASPGPHLSTTSSREHIARPSPVVVDLELMLEIAKVIGKAIAEEMKNSSPAPQPITVCGDGVTPERLERKASGKPIEIDESITDVGLGETAILKRGTESADLITEEVHTDENFGSSKDRLRALKKGS